MAIRAWSFTKFWTVSVCFWLAASVIADIGHYSFHSLGLLSAIVAFAPAFMAGSWAGSHPEIARWPRVRLVSMWLIVLFAVVALNETTNGWCAPLILMGAPAMIFSLRWYEVTGGQQRLREPPEPVIPPDTPPNGSLVS